MSGATPAVRRGRPRDEKARDAILDAAMALLLERGLAGMGVDGVAASAGVSKATIYRWWPTKETLAMDALYREWAAVSPVAETGSLRRDLRNLLWPWAKLVASRPYGRIVAGLLLEGLGNPDFAREYRTRFFEPRRERARVALERAIAAGDLGADIRVDVVLDMLYGPIYHRMLQRHTPIDEAFVGEVVDTVLDGIRSRTADGDQIAS